MRLVATLVVALVTCVHGALWYYSQDAASPPDSPHLVSSFSFSPFNPNVDVQEGGKTSEEQIRGDLKVIAPYTQAVRTYASTGGLEMVPALAAEFGLRVTVGAWLDKGKERNEREMAAAIESTRKSSNINGLVVGNEAIFRQDLTIPELIEYINRAKREVSVPVTTGEIWHVWLEHPELAASVDYIAAHILPYWEGFPVETRGAQLGVVDQTVLIYNRLRQAFPGKKIVIAEFGWPSAGYNRLDADPGRMEQAQVIRQFLSRAEQLGIEYNIIEAIDQPWKTFEGSVGPYWGVFDADRHMKFPLTGAIADEAWWKPAMAAVLMGVALSIPLFSIAGLTFGQAVVLATGAHAVGAWFATIFQYWMMHYFTFGTGLSLLIGMVLLMPLVMIAMTRIEDMATVAFGRRPQRLLPEQGLKPVADDLAPKVSIHIPAYREPPEMLKQTLDSLSRLDYPNFECIVIINNTPDPALWQPIEEHCQQLGPRFKFLNIEKLEGFKAGALRIAMQHTDPDASIIGILDADYVVDPAWLKELVPAFDDPQVGLVQAPQEHRDGDQSVLHHIMKAEYAGFFDIGMVQRNETNSIVVHGTMCLIRRSAMEEAGGWSSDTICEDSDLGLSILELGYRSEYTRKRYGWGLLPDTIEAFRKQRHRWAYGGLQIIRKHWRTMLFGPSLLTRDQKRDYAVGWINWLGAESMGVAVALLNLLWVPVVAFAGIAVPDKILTLPIIASFFVSLLHFGSLYALRVRLPLLQTLGAGLAAMSVQLTVSKAVADGLITEHIAFARTAKGGAAKKRNEFPAFWEAVLGGLLVAGGITVFAINQYNVFEMNLFAVVLMIQSIPFLAAVGLALLENSRLNKFETWSSTRQTMEQTILPSPAQMPTPALNQTEKAYSE